MLILLLTICYQTIQPNEIIFTSQTRGSKEIISIRKDKITFVKNEEQEVYELALSDWNKLIKSIQEIDVNKIQDYPAPSKEHARDAALHSTLSIVVNDHVYTSDTFDDTKAPRELMKLMDCIIHLKKKYLRE